MVMVLLKKMLSLVEDISNLLLTDLVVLNNGSNVSSTCMYLVCVGGEGICELIPSPIDLDIVKKPNVELCQVNMEVINDFSSDLETLVGPKESDPVGGLVHVDSGLDCISSTEGGNY
ncbi:hypothetical protein IEQ34_020942 [Dendrobium chrysotoxum]|uniref:Uncharacterized protein n=1 Tax=Dendrobium chrysotoxum TaxID=161865 RepID=A0AAV7G279_DENCH|nr:hypothetical protein IEQ34_020942 [Dendrobium chrysotoxum]